MKNKYFILLLTFSLLFLTGCAKIKKNADESEEVIPFTYLPTLNHEQFEALYNSDAEFYVYIGRPDCGDSRRFEQSFRDNFVSFNDQGEVHNVKYDLDEKNFYYFDISEIIDTTKTYEQRNEYQLKYGFYYTPSLVHYKNGEVIHIAEWDPTYDFKMTDYMKWFYDTKLIEPSDKVYHEGPTDHIIN